MLIDATHRKWFLGSAIGLALAAAIYIPYSLRAPGGPKGSSTIGLIYGGVGFAFMLFAGLLGLRKKFPVWRVGRAQWWMRGHLWLGFLSFPLILFHGGFHFGGPLTRTLMWIFVVVFASGFLGAALQHFIPRMHTARLPMETIYEQIDRVRGQLVTEARQLVQETCSALEGEVSRASEHQRAAAAGAGVTANLTILSGLHGGDRASGELRQFMDNEIQPYLDRAGTHASRLGSSAQARAMFQQILVLLPSTLHSNLDDLENICEEKRQLDQQNRLHKILHGWLLVHVPLSYALLLLGAWHAVVALKF